MELVVLGGAPAVVVVRYFPEEAETFADAVTKALELREDPSVGDVQIRKIAEPTHPFICGWQKDDAGAWHFVPLDAWSHLDPRSWWLDLREYEREHKLPAGSLTA